MECEKCWNLKKGCNCQIFEMKKSILQFVHYKVKPNYLFWNGLDVCRLIRATTLGESYRCCNVRINIIKVLLLAGKCWDIFYSCLVICWFIVYWSIDCQCE